MPLQPSHFILLETDKHMNMNRLLCYVNSTFNRDVGIRNLHTVMLGHSLARQPLFVTNRLVYFICQYFVFMIG